MSEICNDFSSMIQLFCAVMHTFEFQDRPSVLPIIDNDVSTRCVTKSYLPCRELYFVTRSNFLARRGRYSSPLVITLVGSFEVLLTVVLFMYFRSMKTQILSK